MEMVVKKFKRLAFGIGFSVFLLALVAGQQLDFGVQQLIGYGVMGMIGALAFFGVGAIKNTATKKNPISRGQLLKKGLVIAVLGALGIALADVLFTLVINPDFFDEYHTYAVALAEEQNQTEVVEQLKQQAQLRASSGNVLFSVMAGVFMFIMTFIIGALGAIIGTFMMTKK